MSAKTITRWPGRFSLWKALLCLAILALLMVGCSPRPPTWPSPSGDAGQVSNWHIDAERFLDSTHGGVACETCHTDIVLDETPASHPDVTRLVLSATSLYDYSTCETCHPQEYAAYESGAHAESRAQPEAGSEPSPTCGHCHDPHYATTSTRGELLNSVAETCGDCHAEELESYRNDYHGKATLLGYEQAPTCADCHGAHAVSSFEDSAEIAQACRRCHPQVTEAMTGYRVHAHETLEADSEDPRAGEYALLFWVKLFFTVLVVAVLTFFYVHTGLWFLRSLHERLKRGRHG